MKARLQLHGSAADQTTNPSSARPGLRPLHSANRTPGDKFEHAADLYRRLRAIGFRLRRKNQSNRRFVEWLQRRKWDWWAAMQTAAIPTGWTAREGIRAPVPRGCNRHSGVVPAQCAGTQRATRREPARPAPL